MPLSSLLAESSIILDATATSRDDAVRQAGEALVAAGAVQPSYIEAMLDRERSVSTYVGEHIAIPHGTVAGNIAVTSTALVLLRFAEGVEWNGETVTVVIGIAAQGNGHIALLAQLATALLKPERAKALRDATSVKDVYALLSDGDE
ncbi:MAG: PTS sugar transporter subunit IIA [Microbacteriaceae bacterium]